MLLILPLSTSADRTLRWRSVAMLLGVLRRCELTHGELNGVMGASSPWPTQFRWKHRDGYGAGARYLESDIIFGVTTQASQYRTQVNYPTHHIHPHMSTHARSITTIYMHTRTHACTHTRTRTHETCTHTSAHAHTQSHALLRAGSLETLCNGPS